MTPLKQNDSNQKTVYLYLQSDPMSMDPRIGGLRINQIVLRELFEGLTRIDVEGKPALAVAKDVQISQDMLSYRFHLRPSLWSNGMPVTAYDFEFFLEKLSFSKYSHKFFLCLFHHKKCSRCSFRTPVHG